MKKIRPLRPDEVEVRVSMITAKGCSLLLYKDARCDKRILDETFGIYGWKNEYHEIKGNLFCTVSVWDEERDQWIEKQDCGTESNAEKEKGEASDAFKRACFNIGIGRELYTKIFIWIPVETVQDGNKYKLKNPYEKWYVSKMEVDTASEKITELEICNSKDIVAFTWKAKQPKNTDKKEPEKVSCILCGKEIKGGKSKDGTYLTAVQVANKTDCKCKSCYEKSKNGVNLSSEGVKWNSQEASQT